MLGAARGSREARERGAGLAGGRRRGRWRTSFPPEDRTGLCQHERSGRGATGTASRDLSAPASTTRWSVTVGHGAGRAAVAARLRALLRRPSRAVAVSDARA
eukprot:1447371-Prymnesium_polylepis.1